MTETGKKTADDRQWLTGRLLLAMPGMGDPRFHRAVIFMCAHDENGAMGLIVNNLVPGIDLKQLFQQLNIGIAAPPKDSGRRTNGPVMHGGPVETARGFILHSPDFTQTDTIRINESFSVTGTIDALKAVAGGKGPERMLFVLGYAGWEAGQLDQEIQDNAWLVADADPDLIFGGIPDQKWDRAVKKIGVDPAMLSGEAGHA